MDPFIIAHDVCSGIADQFYLKNIKEVSQRYQKEPVDGHIHEIPSGAIIRSGPGRYITEVSESPQEIAAAIEDAGGTVVFF